MPFHRVLAAMLFAALCVALTPACGAAQALHMSIQSHPDIGGKCLDVPNGLPASGMRVHLWDCNNSFAQIFTYDSQSQELRIGGKCVESWGRGDPNDSVGLGLCNGGAKQHWKMSAIDKYYQIIGVNGLCLDVRYAVKEIDAPVQIWNCDAKDLAELWYLFEAPK